MARITSKQDRIRKDDDDPGRRNRSTKKGDRPRKSGKRDRIQKPDKKDRLKDTKSGRIRATGGIVDAVARAVGGLLGNRQTMSTGLRSDGMPTDYEAAGLLGGRPDFNDVRPSPSIAPNIEPTRAVESDVSALSAISACSSQAQCTRSPIALPQPRSRPVAYRHGRAVGRPEPVRRLRQDDAEDRSLGASGQHYPKGRQARRHQGRAGACGASWRVARRGYRLPERRSCSRLRRRCRDEPGRQPRHGHGT